MTVNHTMRQERFEQECTDKLFLQACQNAQSLANRTGKQMRVYRAYQQWSMKHADMPFYGIHHTLINPEKA